MSEYRSALEEGRGADVPESAVVTRRHHAVGSTCSHDLALAGLSLDSYHIAMKRVSVAEAKNKLPELLHEAAKSGPIEILRRDEPVAVIVAREDFRRLQAARAERPGTYAAIMKWRQEYAAELEDLDLGRVLEAARDQRPARPIKW